MQIEQINQDVQGMNVYRLMMKTNEAKKQRLLC